MPSYPNMSHENPDPYAIAMDAMLIPWTDLQAYAFPPF